jgi:hypothetical protein
MSFEERRIKPMKENRNIRITVRPVADREGEYIAHYASEFLQADFCVYIKDSIFGALALQAFAEMIRKAFGKNYRSQEIDFEVSQEAAVFTNKALVAVVGDYRHAFCA